MSLLGQMGFKCFGLIISLYHIAGISAPYSHCSTRATGSFYYNTGVTDPVALLNADDLIT